MTYINKPLFILFLERKLKCFYKTKNTHYLYAIQTNNSFIILLQYFSLYSTMNTFQSSSLRNQTNETLQTNELFYIFLCCILCITFYIAYIKFIRKDDEIYVNQYIKKIYNKLYDEFSIFIPSYKTKQKYSRKNMIEPNSSQHCFIDVCNLSLNISYIPTNETQSSLRIRTPPTQRESSNSSTSSNDKQTIHITNHYGYYT